MHIKKSYLYKKNQGFVGIIVLIVVALIILGAFNVDVRKVLVSPGVQNNLNYAKDLVITTSKQLIAGVVKVINSNKTSTPTITSTSTPVSN